jgi:adenine-specific DNA-methyltransferase
LATRGDFWATTAASAVTISSHFKHANRFVITEAAMAKKPAKKPQRAAATEIYEHKDATVALRPDVGTQAQFKKQKPTERYRYDSSLSPALEWDGQNSAREQGEALIARILDLSAKLTAAVGPASRAGPVPGAARLAAPTVAIASDQECATLADELDDAARRLKALGKPFLNWAGKAERLSFDVPTLPLFVHERLSTRAIIDTLQGHRKPEAASLFDLFGDPHHSFADQVLKAYEYRDQWTNRMMLGDSLVVMNSLLHFENLGGQVQMIYMDPPYGIKAASSCRSAMRICTMCAR